MSRDLQQLLDEAVPEPARFLDADDVLRAPPAGVRARCAAPSRWPPCWSSPSSSARRSP